MTTTSIDNSNIKTFVKSYINGNLNEIPEDLRTIPIGKWDVSNVKNMNSMFSFAENFNQPLHKWNVSNVENMGSMFSHAISFNQPLNKWGNTLSKVENMSSMFSSASSFNQPLDNWGDKLSNVKDMRTMFAHAYSFRQNLNSWAISTGTRTLNMFEDLEFYEDGENLPLEEDALDELDEEPEQPIDIERMMRQLRESRERLEELERPERRQQQRELQTIALQRAKQAAEAAPLDNSPYDECIICGDPLDNNQGPGSTPPKCRENCNDVVIVCEKNICFIEVVY